MANENKKAGSENTLSYMDPSNFIANSGMKSDFGVAQAHRFMVELVSTGNGSLETLRNGIRDLGGEQSITWNAWNVSVPGVSMAMETSTVGQRPRFYGTEREDQDLKISFFESADMPLRLFFSSWIELIWSPYDTVRNYPDEYTLDGIKVWSYTPEGLGAYYDHFRSVFPYKIEDIDWDVEKSDVVRTDVTFKFKIHTLKAYNDSRSVKSI